jgi:hypothetical protein
MFIKKQLVFPMFSGSDGELNHILPASNPASTLQRQTPAAPWCVQVRLKPKFIGDIPSLLVKSSNHR